MNENASGIGRGLVLIVDDEHAIADCMADLLKEDGYHAIAVYGGREALRSVNEGEPPTVVILDLMMPCVSGWEVLEIWTDGGRHPPPFPVAVMSAVPECSRREISRYALIAEISKPVEVDALLDLVRRVHDRASGPTNFASVLEANDASSGADTVQRAGALRMAR